MDTMSLDRFYGGESCPGGGVILLHRPLSPEEEFWQNPGGGGRGVVTSPAFAKACSLMIRMVMKKHPHHKPPKVNDTGTTEGSHGC